MVEDRIESLQRQHKKLHDTIETLHAEKAPDKYITPFKKRKLAVKDELVKLQERING
jgi:hypothetical protein